LVPKRGNLGSGGTRQKAVVAPRWDSVRVAFHADVASRIPVLAAGGHEELFGTLHPRLRWRAEQPAVRGRARRRLCVGLRRAVAADPSAADGLAALLGPTRAAVRHSLTALGRTMLGQLPAINRSTPSWTTRALTGDP